MANGDLQSLIDQGIATEDTSDRVSNVQRKLERELENSREPTEEELKQFKALEEAVSLKKAFPTGFMDPALYGPEVEDTPFIGTLESFSSSFALGKDMIEKSFWEKMEADAEQGVGFGSIMSSVFGKEFLPGRIEENLQDIERNYQELSRKYEEKPLELSDSWKNPERFFGHDVPLLFGQSLPSVILPLTASAAGAAIGSLAGPGGTVAGAVMAGMAAQGIGVYQEAMAEAGEVLKGTIEELERQNPEWDEERIKKEAFDQSEKAFDRQAAFLAVSEFPQLLLNIFPPAKLLASIGVKGTTAFTKQMAKNALKYPRATNVAKLGNFVSRNVFFEAGQEGFQYYINQDILNESRDETTKRDISWNGLWDDPEFAENVKAGGLMGVFLGGGFKTVNSLMTKQVNDLKNVPIDEAFNKVNNQKELLFLNAISTNNQFTLIGQIEMMRENGLFNDENLKGKEQEKAAKEYADELVTELDNRTQIWNEWNQNSKVNKGRSKLDAANIKMRGYFNSLQMTKLKKELRNPESKDSRTKQQENEINNVINLLNSVNTSLNNGFGIEQSEEAAIKMANKHNDEIIEKEAESIVKQQKKWKRKWKPETIKKWAREFSFEDLYTQEQINEATGINVLSMHMMFGQELKSLATPKKSLIDEIRSLLRLDKEEKKAKGEEVVEEEIPEYSSVTEEMWEDMPDDQKIEALESSMDAIQAKEYMETNGSWMPDMVIKAPKAKKEVTPEVKKEPTEVTPEEKPLPKFVAGKKEEVEEAPIQDLKAQKADIEKRRKEELDAWFITMAKSNMSAHFYETTEKKINDKYDEEIEALEEAKEEAPKKKAKKEEVKKEVKEKEKADWNSLISKSVSEKELDSVMDQIDKANVPIEDKIEYTDAIALKREELKKKKTPAKPAAPAEETKDEVEKKKQIAAIERRRQEEIGTKESRSFTDDDRVTWTVTLSENKDGKIARVRGEKDGKIVQYENKYSKKVSNEKIYETENPDGYEYSDIRQVEVKGKRTDKINARYDAELAALEEQPTAPAEITPEQVHKAAKEAGIIWDDNKAFMDFSEGITGERHIDAMSSEQRGKLIDEIKAGKQPAAPEVKKQPPPKKAKPVSKKLTDEEILNENVQQGKVEEEVKERNKKGKNS